MMAEQKSYRTFYVLLAIIITCTHAACNSGTNNQSPIAIEDMRTAFVSPPDSVRPGVYWYFMDGNMSKEAMTKDLASMQKAGIGSVVFLEVNVGVPRGEVDFLSEEWQDGFAHAVKEAERLNIDVILGAGPGWAGSGGPWVAPEASMRHLVSSTIQVSEATDNRSIMLPLPEPKRPYFGEGGFTPELREKWMAYYEDVAVVAFPTPPDEKLIEDIEEKALYYREPYSSKLGVKPRLPSKASYSDQPDAVIPKEGVVDLTGKLSADGYLDWKVPPGQWTIMRFVSRNNGAVTRPAPLPGLGFEADKFDSAAFRAHLENYVGVLLKKTGTGNQSTSGGLKRLHIDSWEMGAQNWTSKFREEFIHRRGYDPLPFYPVYAGRIVESLETSERFLWDLRLTAQELVLAFHANYLKEYSDQHQLKLSIEPYDMNPNSDFDLGAVADVPMAEFWSEGYGFNTVFSVYEASSIAHIGGKSTVPAEAFTAQNDEAWKQYPGVMKNQGDWAFAMGINQFVYHTFQHQSLADSLRPGMTMGPYGVHWDRNQTWWPLVGDYHQYIARCSYLLQQGRTVADILYVTPEGAPQVFTPPSSAVLGNEILPDKKGYNFDGCSPIQLMQATVKDHQIVFPSGASYQVLVLPNVQTMTPAFLNKIKSLIEQGATVIGNPPEKSPSLQGYPACDQEVKSISNAIWKKGEITQPWTKEKYGAGEIVWGENLYHGDDLYPNYGIVEDVLNEKEILVDFNASDSVRYTHRTAPDWDIYFLANKTDEAIEIKGAFRSTSENPELWDPINGEMRHLPEFDIHDDKMVIPLVFEPYQSFFIVFPKGNTKADQVVKPSRNFTQSSERMQLNGEWKVTFDAKGKGPQDVVILNELQDWIKHPNDSVKYYSGIARYEKIFDFPEASKGDRILIDLGNVKNMARIHLNGKELSTVWTAPWRVDITEAIKEQGNQLKIEVANLWVNRLIGDQQYTDDGVKDGEWPSWLKTNKPRGSQRTTFTTFNPYKKDDTLRSSGLLGPVRIIQLAE